MVKRSPVRPLLLGAALLCCSCAQRLPVADYPRVPTQAFAQNQTQETAMGRMNAAQGKGHKNLSGFHLMPNGNEALIARITLAETAEKSIDLQYFSTRDDTTGKLLLEAVLRAANRGVRVRMLLDDWNLDDFENGLVTLDNHQNIEIRVFNPFSTNNQSILARAGNVFTQSGQFTRRMHNKALMADNQMAVMGGRNLGDEYFGAGADFNFHDMDVLTAGPIVANISSNFDTYWNSKESYPIKALNLPKPDAAKTAKLVNELGSYWKQAEQSANGPMLDNSPLAQEIRHKNVPLVWAPAEFAADDPRKIEQSSDTATSKPGTRVDTLADHARHEFIIISPYFVPLDNGTKWLTSLAKDGIKVRILTNSLASTDMVEVNAAYSHYRKALVEGGVDLYELKAQGGRRPHNMFKGSSQSSLHNKLYVTDRRNLVIGSFNMDPRSEQFNTEQVLVIHSPELAGQVVTLFGRITSPEHSYHLVLKQSDVRSLAPRLRSADSEPDGKRLVWVTEEQGVPQEYDFDPQAGLLRQLANGFFSLLPLDDQM